SGGLIGRKHGGGAAGNWSGILRVIVLVPVHDTAVPGAVTGRRPDFAVRLAAALGMISRAAAGSVLGFPISPIDPIGADVAGVDVDVQGKRHDGNLDIARRFRRRL